MALGLLQPGILATSEVLMISCPGIFWKMALLGGFTFLSQPPISDWFPVRLEIAIISARGFTSYNGLWNGAGDHRLHFTGANFTDVAGSLGFDFHLNDRIQLAALGRWTTDIFVDRVEDLLAARAGLEQLPEGGVHVENEDTGSPMMLYLAYQEPHAPLMVDPKYEAFYPDEEDSNRKTYLGMVSSVDDSVGRIVQLLKDFTYTEAGGDVRSMYDDTVFLFRWISILQV